MDHNHAYITIGLDIGSTTIKCVALDSQNRIVYQEYQRHYSCIVQKTLECLHMLQTRIADEYGPDMPVKIACSGSAGMGIAEFCNIPFVQEVFATRVAAKRQIPEADVIIELGGEDAKILFLTGGTEVRMNGSCAGGTGAFIDQMATLLDMPIDQMDALAQQHEKIYTIASRCGVFAKSDIQPLINQGAKKSDVAASIFYAVVNQTVAGLAQGRPITGNVVYLGGPLSFMPQLRKSFDDTLGLIGVCPENSLYYVALGAAYSVAGEQAGSLGVYPSVAALEQITSRLEQYRLQANYNYIAPLFSSKEDYFAFQDRHNAAAAAWQDPETYNGPAYLGIDAGSTTVKAVLLSREHKILCAEYQSNSGNPVPIVKAFLEKIYRNYPGIEICGSAATGYGEEIIKNAFCIDHGIVETVAHFTAAKAFLPDVEFIIDIGGQDIKCFKIANGAIDNIFLNEACSSGCGSFLQTFAGALGDSMEDFAKRGLFADKPVDLGSRCTVFMNSSVKQAQKDGATIENISAGLSISVVKNALYKVIRATTAGELGKKIVVQGGTFLNDAVLRAFEQELDTHVVRPAIAGLMGAYGAALYAESRAGRDKAASSIIQAGELAGFVHTVKTVSCGLCSNRCSLTVNDFGQSRKFIAGNRCEKPVAHLTKTAAVDDSLNMYAYKLSVLQGYMDCDYEKALQTYGKDRVVGIPLVLNLYEMLPFWHAFFTTLGLHVVTSPLADRKLYLEGQSTIPSDTVCFPAKMAHGAVNRLISAGVTNIFYPCLSYNFDEKLSDNHYNCPVVAYYPEVIAANMPAVTGVHFLKDYFGLHQRRAFPRKAFAALSKIWNGLTLAMVKQASDNAFREYQDLRDRYSDKGREIIAKAREQNLPVIALAGRPYHIDPEIHHGIDRLILNCGAAVVTEDALSTGMKKAPVQVLNQWTYHARLYAAAQYISGQQDINLVQLVSFGCGVDAITTDEMRSILEKAGKIYTQIKIDEITNPGAVKIRLRSLFAAISQ